MRERDMIRKREGGMIEERGKVGGMREGEKDDQIYRECKALYNLIPSAGPHKSIRSFLLSRRKSEPIYDVKNTINSLIMIF